MMPKLQSLNLGGVNVGPKECTWLAAAIPTMAALTSLTIAQNPIGERGATALVEALKSSICSRLSSAKTPAIIRGGLILKSDASKQDISPGYAIIMAWW